MYKLLDRALSSIAGSTYGKAAFAGLLCVIALQGQSLPNAVPAPQPEIQYLDQNGLPLAGAKLCTYAAGTTTPLATYTDSTAGTPNTNPIVLDASGRASVWIGANAYKFVLLTGGDGTCSTGTTIWTQDNVADTTLNFVTFVKNAGTCTLITYNPPNGQAQTNCSAELTALTSSPYVNLKLNCGAKGDGSTNDFAAITTCLGSNQIVYAPPGTYCTQSAIIIPNKTQLLGSGRGDSGGPNTVFKACAGFPTSTPVISLCSTPGPCFGVQAENLSIDCNHIAGCTGGYNAYSQEQSWFRRVSVLNAKAYGFWLDIGTNMTSAAQNSGPYQDLEVLPGADAVATTVCFRALLVPAWRGLRGITCNPAGYSVIPTQNILIEGTSPAHLSDIHLENATNGIQIGTMANAESDVLIEDVQAASTIVNVVNLFSSSVQNVTVIGVQGTGTNVILDNCNSVTLPATNGPGFYATGMGTCGSQTVITTRTDKPINFQTAVTVLKNLNVPGTITSVDDGKICFGPTTPYCIYGHESANSGEPGAVIKTGNIGILVQGASATRGATGGGLSLNGNCSANDPAQGAINVGATSDCATFTARATTAAVMLFVDGGINFYSDTGLTPGNTYTPTLRFRWLTTGHFQVETGGTYSINGLNGFSGTKTAGSCVLTLSGGIITNVTGC